MGITIRGGAGTVTGSRYLVWAGGKAALVDCGHFQGLKQLRLRNREPFPAPPAPVDAVVLTHGEPVVSDALRRRIQDRFGWERRAPEHREHMVLE